MKLNCKPGDLAVIVGGYPTINMGAFVTIVELAQTLNGGLWQIKSPSRPLIGPTGLLVELVDDYCLRPIRDTDGEDEILRIAGKPQSLPRPFARLLPFRLGSSSRNLPLGRR